MIFVPMFLVIGGVALGVYILTRPNKSSSVSSSGGIDLTLLGAQKRPADTESALLQNILSSKPSGVSGTVSSPLPSVPVQPSAKNIGPVQVKAEKIPEIKQPEVKVEKESVKKDALPVQTQSSPDVKRVAEKASTEPAVKRAGDELEVFKKEMVQFKSELVSLKQEIVKAVSIPAPAVQKDSSKEIDLLKDNVGQTRVEIGSLKGMIEKMNHDYASGKAEIEEVKKSYDTLANQLKDFQQHSAQIHSQLEEIRKHVVSLASQTSAAGAVDAAKGAETGIKGEKNMAMPKSNAVDFPPKVGVYLCSCGGSIAETVSFEQVRKAVEGLKDVAVVRTHELMCGKEGLELIAQDIASGKVNRVVTVACSPKMHEKTFVTVCERSGLNPYLLTMANIREQCVWMCADKEQATQKTINMARAAVARARYLKSLDQKEIEINPDTLIIGGGIAGVEAALELTKAGRKVYLVEKESAFGGVLPKLEHTYPSGECAPCILAPRMKELVENESIRMFSNAKVQSAVGFGGNFTVTIEEKPRHVLADKCINCMACIDDCPVSFKNPFNSQRDTRKAIDFLFPGGVPKAPALDPQHCLRFKGEQSEQCTKCKDACAFEAIDYGQKAQTHQIKVGSIIVAIGAALYDVKKVYPQLSFEETDVLTGMDFERLLSTTGPTKGKILLKNGQTPKSVAVVHCVGSRSKKHLPYCSGICCKYAVKHSHSIKQQLPQCEVVHLYSDLCLEGRKMQQFTDEIAGHGVKFVRCQMPENGIAQIKKEGPSFIVTAQNVNGKTENLTVDMVLLAVGLEANPDLKAFIEYLFLNEKDGFVEVQHEKISAVATTAEGVYCIGTSNGPKDITQSVVEAKAAAGEILSTYVPGRKLKLEPMIAESEQDKCGGCKICMSLCPYHAISYDEEKKIVVVSEILCKGCGTCVAACPSGAMQSRNFNYEQLLNEIKGALHG